MVPHAPRGTAGDGPGLVVITARIHSRARLSSFSRSSGVSACSANLTQSRANSSNSFADPDDMSAPTHLPHFDPANAVHRVKFHRAIRGPPLSDRAGGRAAPPPVREQESQTNAGPGVVGLLYGEIT